MQTYYCNNPCYTTYEKNRSKILNILIVDDDNNNAENLKTILNIRGHNVKIVDDGMRCITHCKDADKNYDIVFLDYHLDDLDGAKVADIIKNNEDNGNKKTLIFAYTGDNSSEAIEEFKKAGMDGVIIKPMDLKDVEVLIAKLETCNTNDRDTIKTIRRRNRQSIIIFD